PDEGEEESVAPLLRTGPRRRILSSHPSRLAPGTDEHDLARRPRRRARADRPAPDRAPGRALPAPGALPPARRAGVAEARRAHPLHPHPPTLRRTRRPGRTPRQTPATRGGRPRRPADPRR